jgi:beta-galactosidase
MFHGGTSFGMMAGASASTGNYRGNVTSYDYDAPLDEAGHTTPKFFAYRDMILKSSGEAALPVPAAPKVVAIPEFRLTMSPLEPHLPKPIASETLLTMEQADQAYGYILYRTLLPEAVSDAPLVLDPVHDFARVYLDGKLAGTLDRHYNQTTVALTAGKAARLDILVENTGRLNSTKNMRHEWKGLRSATLAGKPLTGWTIYPLGMQDAGTMKPGGAASGTAEGPHFGFGSFTLTETGDGFLDTSSLGKGVLWINGRCLGRFWAIGPQVTLYVPGPWLKQGRNDVVIFDLFAASEAPTLIGRMKPILDGPTPTYASDPERTKKAAADAEFGPKLTAPAPTAPPQTPKA